MSDCKVPMYSLQPIDRPTLKRLGDLHGNPPWELQVPDYGVIPQEATEFVGSLVWRGERFERVRECEMKWTPRYCPPDCMVPQDMVQTCSACGGLGNEPDNPFHPDDPNEPIQFSRIPSYIRYCPLCGARIMKGNGE